MMSSEATESSSDTTSLIRVTELRSMMRNYFIRSSAALCYEMHAWLFNETREGNGQAVVLSMMLRQIMKCKGDPPPGLAAAAYISSVDLYDDYLRYLGKDPEEVDVPAIVDYVCKKMKTLH
jgi:hypothetical protein